MAKESLLDEAKRRSVRTATCGVRRGSFRLVESVVFLHLLLGFMH